jgi:hypothetical protein
MQRDLRSEGHGLDSDTYCARRAGRLPRLGVITVVLITGLTRPAIATPGSAANSDVAGEGADR